MENYVLAEYMENRLVKVEFSIGFVKVSVVDIFEFPPGYASIEDFLGVFCGLFSSEVERRIKCRHFVQGDNTQI